MGSPAAALSTWGARGHHHPPPQVPIPWGKVPIMSTKELQTQVHRKGAVLGAGDPPEQGCCLTCQVGHLQTLLFVKRWLFSRFRSPNASHGKDKITPLKTQEHQVKLPENSKDGPARRADRRRLSKERGEQPFTTGRKDVKSQ